MVRSNMSTNYQFLTNKSKQNTYRHHRQFREYYPRAKLFQVGADNKDTSYVRYRWLAGPTLVWPPQKPRLIRSGVAKNQPASCAKHHLGFPCSERMNHADHVLGTDLVGLRSGDCRFDLEALACPWSGHMNTPNCLRNEKLSMGTPILGSHARANILGILHRGSSNQPMGDVEHVHVSAGHPATLATQRKNF